MILVIPKPCLTRAMNVLHGPNAPEVSVGWGAYTARASTCKDTSKMTTVGKNTGHQLLRQAAYTAWRDGGRWAGFARDAARGGCSEEEGFMEGAGGGRFYVKKMPYRGKTRFLFAVWRVYTNGDAMKCNVLLKRGGGDAMQSRVHEERRRAPRHTKGL